MRALDPRSAGGFSKSLVALAVLVPLGVGLGAAGGGAALLAGILIPLGVLAVVALAAARHGTRRGPALFTWQQVQVGMERELRRTLRRRRWRRRLHLGTPPGPTAGTGIEKTSA